MRGKDDKRNLESQPHKKSEGKRSRLRRTRSTRREHASAASEGTAEKGKSDWPRHGKVPLSIASVRKRFASFGISREAAGGNGENRKATAT